MASPGKARANKLSGRQKEKSERKEQKTRQEHGLIDRQIGLCVK